VHRDSEAGLVAEILKGDAMLIEGIVFCDYCGLAIFPDEGLALKIGVHGRLHNFDFHNTLERPCLKMKLQEMRERCQSTVPLHPA
jgi:hypothetical protein